MTGYSRRPAFGLAFVALLFFLPTLEASEVVVSPVRLRIDYEKNTTTLRLTNKFEKKILFHSESFLWTQEYGAEKLDPTKDMMVMPPIFTLEPNKSQLIRIMFRGSKSQTKELTYRLIINEVPQETIRVDDGVRTKLQISIPIFVKPKVKAKPLIEYFLQRINEKNLRFTLKNTGNAHILLGTIRLFAKKGHATPIYETALSGYVLSDQSKAWSLNLANPVSQSNIFVEVDTDDGKKEMLLPIQ